MKRCFISINLPELTAGLIFQKIHGKFEGVLSGREENYLQYHLTIKFLGNISEEKLDEVIKNLEEIKFSSFEVEVGKLGYFENKFRGILYVELLSGELESFIGRVLEKVNEENQNLKIHVTLMRSKKASDKEKLKEEMEKIDFADLKFEVDKFYLMESNLTGEGAKYKVLREFSLEN